MTAERMERRIVSLTNLEVARKLEDIGWDVECLFGAHIKPVPGEEYEPYVPSPKFMQAVSSLCARGVLERMDKIEDGVSHIYLRKPLRKNESK